MEEEEKHTPRPPRLYLLLREFSSKEIKMFSKYLISPYFKINNRDVIVRCFDQLKSHNFQLVNHEGLWKVLFPVGAKHHQFDYDILRQIYSRLLKAAMDFLAYEQVKESNDFRLKRIQELLKKGLVKPLENLIKKERKSIDEAETINSDNFFFLYQIELFSLAQYLIKSKADPKVGQKDYLTPLKYLDIFYISERIRLECSLRTSSLSYNFKLEERDTLKFFESIPNDGYSQIPLVETHLLLYKLYFEGNWEAGLKLIQKLGNIESDDSNQIKYDYFCLVLNIGLELSNLGKIKNSEIFKILSQGFDGKILSFENSFCSLTHLKNLIRFGVRNDSAKEVEELLKKESKYLSEGDQKRFSAFYLAELNLRDHNPREALLSLGELPWDNKFWSYTIKIIRAKCYYLLREDIGFFRSLENLIDTLRVNTPKDKVISKTYGQGILIRVKLLKKLTWGFRDDDIPVLLGWCNNLPEIERDWFKSEIILQQKP